MSGRTLLTVARWLVAGLLAGLGVKAAIAAFQVPIEAGGILFAPMLLGVAGLAVIGALALIVPWWRHAGSKDGGAFWAALGDLLFPGS